DIVQRKQGPLILVQPAPGAVEPSRPECRLGFLERTGAVGDEARGIGRLDRIDVAAIEAPQLIDEDAAHHAQQPAVRLIEPLELVEARKGTHADFLHEIFRIRDGAREAVSRAVKQRVMPADQRLEPLDLRLASLNERQAGHSSPRGRPSLTRLKAGFVPDRLARRPTARGAEPPVRYAPSWPPSRERSARREPRPSGRFLPTESPFPYNAPPLLPAPPAPRTSCIRRTACAISRSSPMSTMARRRSSTSCCSSPARSTGACNCPSASSTRTISGASAASRSSRRTPRSAGGTIASTSSTRPATPISAARSSACCRWSTACCCSSTPSTGRCRRPAS